MLSYQNCAESSLDESEEVETFSSFSETAVNAKFDTLGYMSCSDMAEADPSAYFSFRAGAYDNGGLELSNTVASASDISASNQQNLQMQFSLRRASDFVLFSAQATPAEGRDFANIMPLLGDAKVIERLSQLESGERLKYVPNSNLARQRFEGSLSFLNSEFLAQSVRTELRNGAYLALTFNDSTGESATRPAGPADLAAVPTPTEDSTDGASPAAAPVVSNKEVFGTGLKVTFKQGNTAQGNATRVLASVQEEDLRAKNPQGQWTCPADMVFKIVRQIDADAVKSNGQPYVNCNRETDPAILDDKLKKVRRVLRVEDWWVDMTNQCIIPKTGKAGQCYGNQTDIEYANGSCGGAKACAHFFSVCIKTS